MTEKNTVAKPLNKIKYILLMLIAVAVMLTCLVSCNGQPQYNADYVYDGFSLIGLWREYNHDDSFYQLYEFKADGSITVKSYTYGIKDEQIEGSYSVSDTNSITIEYYMKDGNYKETSNFSIDEWGTLVIYTLGEMGYQNFALVPYDLGFNQGENPLLGNWQLKDDNDVCIYFGEDYYGHMYYVSNPLTMDEFVYSFRGNELYMLYVIRYEGTPDIPSGELIAPSYVIENDTLTIYGNDANGARVELIYERKN